MDFKDRKLKEVILLPKEIIQDSCKSQVIRELESRGNFIFMYSAGKSQTTAKNPH